MNYYEILKVAPTATTEEIRLAYIALCKDLHPDKLGNLNENLRKLAEEQLKLVNQAYETLKDTELRTNYDQKISAKKTQDGRDMATKNKAASPTLDELLSTAILDEGFQIFVQEEEALWQNFTNELSQIRERYHIQESSNSSLNLFPDDLGMKLARIFSLILEGFIGIGLVVICFGLFAGVVAFIVAFAINVFLFPLGGLVVWLYFNIFLPFLVIAYFGIIIMGIFTDDELTDETRRKQEKTEAIFSQSIHRYWQQTEDLGANFRAYKFFADMYPTDYVNAVREVREKLSKQIKELIGHRKDKIKMFKDLSPTRLTCEYVSGLSACERLLLMKALQQKAEEAQQEQQNEEFASFLRAAGAVVLLGILFGGGGGF
ncbi:DnaJ-class molecular chaperone with C-terminal Zn finger domain [Gloeomargarita lithophora Alchichica-D10]|uniref:DnaJ-class molecular chaperone with C-terminal Zn finger domain n=1 Tax=Gloeomargarita lithophora Alchichica-D10 TaxID=1188229 RepID=A0A1J0AAH6_9CYAN|nr:DnaJ domain-containing protein [Gloeomargarita lithophora]APB32934.1 DnaJ-class molecular chaperone with C-terminal Zn finger domain [Gloeomargarita lithophora Alchichica-D10]